MLHLAARNRAEWATPDLRWYALHVRSRHEKLTAAALRNRGYQVFLPLYRSRRRWSDRIKELDLPLFPCYVFCQFDALCRLPVLTTFGVIEIVGTGRMPTPVDDGEIAAIQRVIESGLAAEPWPYVKVGDTVRVEQGALSGLEGVLLQIKKQHRLVLSVTLLQRSVAVEIDRDWVGLVRSADSRRRTDQLLITTASSARGRLNGS